MNHDAFLLEHTPGPTVEVAPSVGRARSALTAATRQLLPIPDSALESSWAWRDDEADIRYGLYRGIEVCEEAAAEAARVLRTTGARRTPAADRIGPATAARWDLQGLLATLDDATLDRHPRDGEWTARETLGHIINGQRAYGAYTAWWLSRPGGEPDLTRVPEEVVRAAALPEEETEGEGTLADLRGRLDAVLDVAAGRFAILGDADLAKPARWAGIPVTVGFRVSRWSSHLIEHTLQLDKTMAWLGLQPTEVQRLVRLIHAAYGRLEALVMPMPAAHLAVSDDRGRSVDSILDGLAAELVADATSARVAAGVAAPAG